MCTIVQCIFLITFIELVASYPYKILNIVDLSQHDENGNPLVIKAIDRKGLRSGDVFQKFIRDMLDLLSTDFPGRKLVRYCRTVSSELYKFEFKYTRRLAKHFRELSKMDRDELKSEMQSYRKELEKDSAHLRTFLDAMNSVFTLQQSILFRDYVFDVRDYGNEDKIGVKEETRSVLNAIVGEVKKLRVKDQIELEKKMRKAIKEHTDPELDIDVHTFVSQFGDSKINQFKV